MGEKSHELGGQRSNVRHNIDQLGGFGAAYFVLNRFVENGTIDTMEAAMLFGSIQWAVSALGKAASTYGPKLLARYGFTLSLFLLLSGCAIQLGRSTPHEFTGANGETIIACDVQGISVALGDADICRNVEGGHVGRDFVDMTLGVVKAAGSIVAGFFTGLGGAGQGMQAAVNSGPPPVTGGYVEEPAPPPAVAPEATPNPFLSTFP